MQVFLQPVDDTNFNETIVKGRTLTDLNTLNANDIDELTRIYGKEDISIWGVESKSSITYWKYIDSNKTIQDDQQCFFYRKGKIVGVGTIVYSCVSPALASVLWNSSSWSHIYFIKNFKSLQMPLNHFNSLLQSNYDNVKGFHRINGKKAKIIERDYKTFTKKVKKSDKNIPDDITKQHILDAVNDFNEGVIVHCFEDSTDYDVIIDNEEYPPKAIIGIASRHASKGRVLLPAEFGGGLNTKCFDILEKYDFFVQVKSATRKRVNKKRKSYESILKRLSKEKDLNKKVETNQRQEQGILREYLFDGLQEEHCSICNELYPISLLVTGHIKLRTKCSNEEKLDIENVVMPVCKFGCDDLYEKGFIKVKSDGTIYNASTDKNTTSSVQSYIAKVNGKVCSKHNKKSEKYFKWHRENI